MPAVVLNGTSHANNTAHLQIKYNFRSLETRQSTPFFSSLRASMPSTPAIVATIADDTQSQSWRITASIPNTSTREQTLSLKVQSWPMFAPEESRLVASTGTSNPNAPSQCGRAEIEVRKRELADFDERTGKWVLEEGIYMFEIKNTEDQSGAMSVVKQVSVVGHLEWDH